MSNFSRAVVVILIAILLFDFQGAIIKVLGDRYSVPQIATFRNIFGLIPSLLILYFSQHWHAGGRNFRLPRLRLALLRGVSIAVAQFFFYWSLTIMEFATASTLAFAGPLFITALSVPILKSQVGWMRWIAVIIGFVGIVLVMQPQGGEVFDSRAIIPVVAAFGYAMSSVLVRLFDESSPTALINLYTTLAALTCSTVLMFSLDMYQPIQSPSDWLWMLALGMVGGVAVFCLIVAYRLTQPSNLSPFEYFGIPFSFAIGFVFFNEAPIGKLFPGVLLIIAGGLLIVWRERRNQNHGIAD
ncbi:MAG: DMT family transporter [bacterium]